MTAKLYRLTWSAEVWWIPDQLFDFIECICRLLDLVWCYCQPLDLVGCLCQIIGLDVLLVFIQYYYLDWISTSYCSDGGGHGTVVVPCPLSTICTPLIFTHVCLCEHCNVFTLNREGTLVWLISMHRVRSAITTCRLCWEWLGANWRVPSAKTPILNHNLCNCTRTLNFNYYSVHKCWTSWTEPFYTMFLFYTFLHDNDNRNFDLNLELYL